MGFVKDRLRFACPHTAVVLESVHLLIFPPPAVKWASPPFHSNGALERGCMR